MSPAPHSAAEHQPRPLPERVEVCLRCYRGLVYRRGPDGGSPYCPTCGAEEPGHFYRAEAATS